MNDNSKPPNDDTKHLADFSNDGFDDDHKLSKRNSHTGAAHAFAVKAEHAEQDAKKHKPKREVGPEPDTDPKPKIDNEPSKGDRKVSDVSKEKSPPQPERKSRDTTKHEDPSKKDQHRIARDTTTKDEKPKRIARDVPDPSKPIPQPPKPVPINKRDTGKEEPKTHIDTDKDEKQRKTRSITEDKDKAPEHKSKRDTEKDDQNKHIDNDKDDHERKSRATDEQKDKNPDHKSKREAKESKPDPKAAKKQPPPKSESSNSNGKH